MINKDFHIIIPARYSSTRLPGKLLLDLCGKSVLERVYQQALKSGALSVTIATDNQELYDFSCDFGAEVVMTSEKHTTGTDRIAEAIKTLNFLPSDIVVNVQGDEPFIDPLLIKQVANGLSNSTASMSTLCWPIEDEAMLTNPNVVKVVRNQNNCALYFSRSHIPFDRDAKFALKSVFRHIGLYAYRVAFLLDFVTWPICELEQIEVLEQLRALWQGHKILVEEACVMPLQDVNTIEDLQAARQYLNSLSTTEIHY